MRDALRVVGARTLRAALGLLGFGLLWWAAVVVFAVPDFLLPAPPALWPKLRFLAENARLGAHLGTTVAEIAQGFVIGAVIGVVLGVAFARSPRLERLASPLVVLVQTAPKIAIAPLLLLWLGLGPLPKVVLVAGVVFFPVLAGAVTGFRFLDPAYRDLATVLRLSRWQRLRRIDLPFALPPILAGLRIATTQAVTAAVIGELMGANLGLGYLLTVGQENGDAGLVLAVVLLLCLLGWLFHEAVALLEHAALSWHGAPRG